MTSNLGATTAVRDAHRFDEAGLARYLADHLPGFRGPMAVRQFEGGQSNPTYLLQAASGDYVLRKKPPGRLLPSAHQVDREYRVMTALQGTGVPVPPALVSCEDEDVIGTGFFVMESVPGRVFRNPRLPVRMRARQCPRALSCALGHRDIERVEGPGLAGRREQVAPSFALDLDSAVLLRTDDKAIPLGDHRGE